MSGLLSKAGQWVIQGHHKCPNPMNIKHYESSLTIVKWKKARWVHERELFKKVGHSAKTFRNH